MGFPRILSPLATTGMALALASGLPQSSITLAGFSVAVLAQTDAEGPKGPRKGEGHEDGGHEDDGHEDGSHEGGGHSGGQGGSGNAGQGAGGPGSGGEGGQGAGKQGDTGGKPVWAQEGIPPVELGRLNVARSPEQVIDRAFAEALASLSPEMVAFYNLGFEAMRAELSLNWDNVSFIDSPLQNIALMRDALDGTSILTSRGIGTAPETLVSVFLGVASDKNIPITPATVVALTSILGMPVTGSASELLAARAEAIRIAILAGHG